MLIKRCTILCFLIIFFSGIFSFAGNAFAFTIINTDIEADTTWSLSGSPYILERTVSVLDGATLSIDSGVEVKFKNSNNSIYIFGKLLALGTSGEPIVFTSNADDTYSNTDDEEFCFYNEYDDEGNPIGDEVCEYYDLTDPFRGDWGDIYFIDSADSVLDYVNIRYGRNTLTLQNSKAILKNINIYENTSGLIMFTDSSAELENAFFDSLEKDAIALFNDSFLNIKNVNIKNIDKGVITVFNNSSLFGEGLVFEENIFTSASEYIALFNHSSLVLKGSSFTGCPRDACITFFDGDPYIANPSILNIENSVFDGGAGSAFLTFGDSAIDAQIHNSTITNFPNFGIENYSSATTVKASKNFWGHPSGPYQEAENPTGLGTKIQGKAEFTPWCKTSECIFRNPVIFIPGTTGSFLYKDYDDKKEIWPNLLTMLLPGADSYLNDLALEVDGTENTERPIKPNDIIRKLSGVDVFGSMIEDLEAEGYVEGVDLFVFAYDWRKSVADSAIKLKEKIDDILLNSDSDKVDLLNHSMGGLVAKKYIADNGSDKVDQLFFFGTPHLGAPKGFKALMYGDSMGFEKFLLGLNPARVKFIGQNMPGVYELMPSQKYFDKYTHYVVDARDKENIKSLNFEETKDLMIDSGRNTLMFPFAKDLHDTLDELDLTGVETHNFIGCGTKTIGQITLIKKRSWQSAFLKKVDDYEIGYINGDQTVPLYSALETPLANKYFVKNITHGTLPSSLGLRQNVLAILNGNAKPTSPDILENADNCKVSGKVVSTHSPVELHIYDESGNHTGMNADGEMEYGIEGVEYDSIEDVNYAFLPDGINFKIIIKATDTGGYTFNVEDLSSEDIVEEIHKWTLVPLETLDSKGEISIGPDYLEEDYEIKMDQDGDGEVDKVYAESFNGTSEAEEATAPKPALRVVFPHGVVLLPKEDPTLILPTNSNLENSENNIIPIVLESQVLSNPPILNQAFAISPLSSPKGLVAGASTVNEKEEVQEVESIAPKGKFENDKKQPRQVWPVFLVFGAILALLIAKKLIKL